MTEPKTKETKICDTCWSQDVSFDASATWDIKKQDFVIDDIRDSDWCSSCE